MARKNTNLKLVAKKSGKPREQTLKEILELADDWVYGSLFSDILPETDDRLKEFERIGIDSYFRDWPSDYKNPTDITATEELRKTITESLATEALKDDVNDLFSRCTWRAFFSARGGFAVGVFLGLRLAGTPDVLIERIGRQFVDRD